MKTVKKILKIAVIVIIWLLIWELIHLAVGKDLLVPSPQKVFAKIIELGGTGPFWRSIGTSILRVVVGYAAAVVMGSLIGVLAALFGWIDSFLSPISKIIRATPVASFIILLFVFLARNHIPVVTAFLMVFPTVWANVYEGIKATDKKLLEMAQVFRLKKGVVIKRIYAPEVMPFFAASLKTGVGLAWKSAIAAEVLTNPSFGIGSAIYNSKIYLETTDLFAWTAVIIVLSIILERLMIRAIGRIYK